MAARLNSNAKKGEAILDLTKYINKGVHVRFFGGRAVSGVLKGFDHLVNLVLDGATEYLRGTWRTALLVTQCWTRPFPRPIGLWGFLGNISPRWSLRMQKSRTACLERHGRWASWFAAAPPSACWAPRTASRPSTTPSRRPAATPAAARRAAPDPRGPGTKCSVVLRTLGFRGKRRGSLTFARVVESEDAEEMRLWARDAEKAEEEEERVEEESEKEEGGERAARPRGLPACPPASPSPRPRDSRASRESAWSASERGESECGNTGRRRRHAPSRECARESSGRSGLDGSEGRVPSLPLRLPLLSG
ncbi:unnamed protein product [Lampetra fluviatilis]